MKKDIILIGGGGHCKSCIDVIEMEGNYRIVGILDLPNQLGRKQLNYEVIGSDEDLPKYFNQVDPLSSRVGEVFDPSTLSLQGVPESGEMSSRYGDTSTAEEGSPTLSPLGHILSGVGNIADYISLGLNKPDEVNLGRVAPERVDYSRDRLAMEEDALMARRMNATAARNLGLNTMQTQAGIATGNTGVNRVLGQSRSKSFQDQLNTNAMLKAEANKMNAQLAAEEAAMNAQYQNMYKTQRAAANPIGALARTGASYFADNAAYRRGYDTMRMLAPNAKVTKPADYNMWDMLIGRPYDVTFQLPENKKT